MAPSSRLSSSQRPPRCVAPTARRRRSHFSRRLSRPPTPPLRPSPHWPSQARAATLAVLRPRTAHSLAQTLPLSRGGASTMCHDIACAAAIYFFTYLPSSRRYTVKMVTEPANLVDEKLGLGDFISPPRAGFFGNLFVGGQEAVCAVAIEPPPPIPRARMRSFDLSDAFAHPSAGDSRASRVARGRGGRAPRVQDRSGPWVDQGRRALAGLRPRLRRRGRLESNRLHVLNPRRLTLWGVGSGVSVSPPCVAGVARATTCTARAADVFPAGAWPPSSSASALVSSSRACTRALDTVRTASSLLPNTPLGPQPDAHSELVWQVAMAGDCARCLRQVLHLR